MNAGRRQRVFSNGVSTAAARLCQPLRFDLTSCTGRSESTFLCGQRPSCVAGQLRKDIFFENHFYQELQLRP